MHYRDKDIAKRIRIPDTLPITMTRQSYVASAVAKVRRELRRGKTIDQALATVNMTSGVVSRSSRAPWIMGALVAVCTILVTIVVWSTAGHGGTPASRLLSVIPPIKEDHYVLVTGVDTRPPVDRGDGSSADVPGSRTDTIAVAYVPAHGKSAALINIPRDTNVTVQSCQKWNPITNEYAKDTFSATNIKINAAYSSGGPQCLLTVVNALLGTSIDEYAEVNFDAFTSIVDRVGTIDLEIKEPVVDDVLGVIFPRSGVYHADGKTALQYARARMVDGTPKDDMSRIKRQQQVLESLKNTISEQGKSTDPLFIKDVVDIIRHNTKTMNISTTNAMSLASTVAQIPQGSIHYTTLPTAGVTENGNLVADEKRIPGVMDTVELLGRDMSSTAVTDTVDAKNLHDITVTVVSRSKFDERLPRVEKILQGKVKRVDVTTDDIVADNTTVYMNETNRPSVVSMARLFPSITVTSHSLVHEPPTDVTIVLGSDSRSVFSSMFHGDVSGRYTIPVDFTGTGRQLVPTFDE